MSDINPYQAPAAPLTEPAAGAIALEQPQRFYVVAPRKFLVLYIATFGMYRLYWMYKNWANLKVATGRDVWPVPRSLFQIFFYHSLFREVDAALRDRPERYGWDHTTIATAIVVASIAENLISRHNDTPLFLLAQLGVMAVIAYQMMRAQEAINLASNDPDGAGNQRFGAANIAWIVFGVLFWLLILIGVFLPDPG